MKVKGNTDSLGGSMTAARGEMMVGAIRRKSEALPALIERMLLRGKGRWRNVDGQFGCFTTAATAGAARAAVFKLVFIFKRIIAV